MGQIFYSNLIKKRRTKKKIKVTILHSRQKSFIFNNNMLSFAHIFDTNFQRDRRLNSKLKISINAKMFCSIRRWLIAKKADESRFFSKPKSKPAKNLKKVSMVPSKNQSSPQKRKITQQQNSSKKSKRSNPSSPSKRRKRS